MQAKDVDIIKNFEQYSHEIEENFAQMLSLNAKLRLTFNHQNQAYTDGENISVDPAFEEIFADDDIKEKALDILQWPRDTISSNEEAIYVVEHAQLIHECLHQLYTQFPLPAYTDPLASNENKRKILATIANIIEDSYIEAIGASKYNNIKFFLQFFRTCVSIIQDSNRPASSQGSSDKMQFLTEYMNYFIAYKLYPMGNIHTPSLEIKEYVQKTKPLFNMATMTGEPEKRYVFAQKIFEIIKPLIPHDHEERVDQNEFNEQMPGSDTHNSNKTQHEASQGQSQTPDQSLFPQPADQTDEASQRELKDPTEDYLGDNLFDGMEEENGEFSTNDFKSLMKAESQSEQSQKEIKEFAQSLTKAMQKQEQAKEEEKENNKTQSIRIGGDEFKEFTAHKNIEIRENHPAPDKSLKQRYNELYNEFKSNINYYNGCFLQMLQTNRTVKESGYQYGSSISTKKLGDTKKRYWCRNIDEQDTPDLAVLILIDGSGSMSGNKRDNAIKSAIILHEVLQKQGINHSIVEHRAFNSQNVMEANILVDFNGRNEQKFNILKIRAYNVNRDGLSLLWAERYISKQSNENKLIIIISDGQPNHNGYSGRVAKEDTRDIAKQIEKHNINIIGVALEEDGSVCYEDLKNIYPNLINCPTPNKLTRKLLEIIKKVL